MGDLAGEKAGGGRYREKVGRVFRPTDFAYSLFG
jgi:hypothetical protein